jgi:hypothetical protein
VGLVKALLPGLIVAAALVGSYVVRPAETAIDVRLDGARRSLVKVVKPGDSQIVAQGQTNGGQVRLAVDPGRYVVGGDRLRSVRVSVAEDEVVSVVLERR